MATQTASFPLKTRNIGGIEIAIPAFYQLQSPHTREIPNCSVRTDFLGNVRSQNIMDIIGRDKGIILILIFYPVVTRTEGLLLHKEYTPT